jgi:DNA modification methylase
MAQFGALSAQYKVQHEHCVYVHRKDESPYWYGPNNETTLWLEDRASKNEYHPTQKPTALAKRAINNSSLAGDLVIDLFGGSGSTLIACEETNRACRTMEINPKYVQVIIDRWDAFTKQEAKRVEVAA